MLILFCMIVIIVRLWTSGTRLWLAWWRTSARRSSTRRTCSIFSSSVRTRSRHVSRSDSTRRCRVGSRRSCSTRRRSSEVSACCRWATFWFHSLISAGRSRPMLASHISGPAWATRKISWSQISTGNPFWLLMLWLAATCGTLSNWMLDV